MNRDNPERPDASALEKGAWGRNLLKVSPPLARPQTLPIPYPNGDYINFTRPLNSTSTPVGVAPLLDMVRKVMAEKCLAYELVSTRPRLAHVYEIQSHQPSQALSD